MMTLIKKDKELQQLLDLIPETAKGTLVRIQINKAIEKAYKSGLCRFSAIDNTMVAQGYGDTERNTWSRQDYNFETGENATLIRTYLVENGYIN